MDPLEEIKSKIDLVSLVSEYVQLKKTGRNFKGLCPFHTEKTPSFVVSPERQIWHCFGGCQVGGDIFGFLMRIENIEFPESLKILAKRAGVTLKSYQSTPKSELREKIYAVNNLASEFYHYVLLNHPAGETARKYLDNRKISPGSIKLFRIGYAPNSWNSLINFLTKKGFKISDLITAGLVSESDRGHTFDRFRGRVIFTLFDNRDNVVGFAGRTMDPQAKEAKYINTAETPVYIKGNILYGLNTTKEEIKKSQNAVVVEGEIDAIQSYQAGIKNVVAIKGSAFTSEQVNLLKRYTENITLSLDADLAGDAAAHRGILIADSVGLNIKVTTFSEGKDPDDLIRKDPKLWRQAVDRAVPFYDFIISAAAAKYDPQTVEGQKKIITETSGFLARIDNLVVKKHYLKKLAGLISSDEDTLEIQLEKEAKKQEISKFAKTETFSSTPETPQTRKDKLEDYLLALLLQKDDLAENLRLLKDALTPADFTNPAKAKIYHLLLESKGQESPVKFIAGLPPELTPTADRLYLLDTDSLSLEPEQISEELAKSANTLKELTLRSQLKELTNRIKTGGDEGAVTGDFTKLSQKLNAVLKSDPENP